MSSGAANRFLASERKASILMKAPSRLRGVIDTHDKSRVMYQAYIASIVGFWNAFVLDVIQEATGKINDPSSSAFMQLKIINKELYDRFMIRFNTPNAEKSREQLLLSLGYDPWPDWVWNRAKMNSQQVRQRLNEILQIRHSFAHGLPLPYYDWNTSPSGKAILNGDVASNVGAFLKNLVAVTDAGLNLHLNHIFGIDIE